MCEFRASSQLLPFFAKFLEGYSASGWACSSPICSADARYVRTSTVLNALQVVPRSLASSCDRASGCSVSVGPTSRHGYVTGTRHTTTITTTSTTTTTRRMYPLAACWPCFLPRCDYTNEQLLILRGTVHNCPPDYSERYKLHGYLARAVWRVAVSCRPAAYGRLM